MQTGKGSKEMTGLHSRCCPTCGHPLENETAGITLDLKTNTILTKNGDARLTPTLSLLIELLLQNTPEFVCNERIYMRIWGSRDISVSDYSIIVAVKRLRKILKPLGFRIENRSRVGYRIREMERSA